MEGVEIIKSGTVHYIAHYFVFKYDSSTTQLSIVFDASCNVDGVFRNRKIVSESIKCIDKFESIQIFVTIKELSGVLLLQSQLMNCY